MGMDRLTILKTHGFAMQDKLKITRNYLLPELLKNVGMNEGDVTIETLEQLRFICRRWNVEEKEGGVRMLKQALEAIILNVNKIRMLQGDGIDFDELTAQDGLAAQRDAEDQVTIIDGENAEGGQDNG